jgi:BCD family chlorophyll transporter-like MFS transporter
VLADPSTGYVSVYAFEIILLLATIIALGPLVRGRPVAADQAPTRFGLSEFPI